MLTLDGLDLTGSGIIASSIDGLINGPAAVFAQEQRVQADGSWATRAWAKALSGSISGSVMGDDRDELLDSVIRAASMSTVALVREWRGRPVTLFVRRDGEVDIDLVTRTYARWQVSLMAPDPHWWVGDLTGQDEPSIYSPGVISDVTGLPASVGGISFPISFPLSFNAAATSGEAIIDNPGSGGRLWLRLDGPLVAPRVTVTSGERSSLLAWPNLTLAEGEWLVVDVAARTSLLMGQASRPPSTRQWPTVSGGQLTAALRATSGSGALTASLLPSI